MDIFKVTCLDFEVLKAFASGGYLLKITLNKFLGEFVAGLVSSFLYEKAPRKVLQENPRQKSFKICTAKVLDTLLQTGGAKKCLLYVLCCFCVFEFCLSGGCETGHLSHFRIFPPPTPFHFCLSHFSPPVSCFPETPLFWASPRK